MEKKPTKKDINVHNSLDEQVACDHFFNKTIEIAELLFRENSMVYQEDLRWMGINAFNYYIHSVINYLKSDYSIEDDSFIDFLYYILKNRMENEFSFINQSSFKESIQYIIINFNKFAIDEDIYGDLLTKYKQLFNKLN